MPIVNALEVPRPLPSAPHRQHKHLRINMKLSCHRAHLPICLTPPNCFRSATRRSRERKRKDSSAPAAVICESIYMCSHSAQSSLILTLTLIDSHLNAICWKSVDEQCKREEWSEGDFDRGKMRGKKLWDRKDCLLTCVCRWSMNFNCCTCTGDDGKICSL